MTGPVAVMNRAVMNMGVLPSLQGPVIVSSNVLTSHTIEGEIWSFLTARVDLHVTSLSK